MQLPLEQAQSALQMRALTELGAQHEPHQIVMAASKARRRHRTQIMVGLCRAHNAPDLFLVTQHLHQQYGSTSQICMVTY